MGCGASTSRPSIEARPEGDLPPVPQHYADEMHATIAGAAGRHAESDHDEECGFDIGSAMSVDTSFLADAPINQSASELSGSELTKHRLLQHYVRYVNGRTEGRGGIDSEASKERRMSMDEQLLNPLLPPGITPVATLSGTYRAARSNRHYSEPPSQLQVAERKLVDEREAEDEAMKPSSSTALQVVQESGT